jgi:hypothetical protein
VLLSDSRLDVAPDRAVAGGDEGFVPIGELLDWEGPEEKRPIDTRIGRLAGLLGIAAVALAVLVIMFAAGTDVASLFRNVPGS